MNTVEQGRTFERRVGHLFSLLGYKVDYDALVSGRQVDLVIEDDGDVLARHYIVECKDQAAPVNAQQYDAFRGRLVGARRELSPRIRGLIVASVGFTKEIKAQSRNEDIEMLTISELERKVIDFRGYVHSLIGSLEDEPSLRYFVEPSILLDQVLVPEPALAYFEQWLADPESNQLTLLGDYGTGKTTLLRHFALQVARRYEAALMQGDPRGRVPLFVDLRDYTQAISFRQVILDLLDRHSIRAAKFAAFEYVSREGQLLLIIDGFDEMATRGNYQVTLRNFRELNQQAFGRAKIILSCRTHYFTDAAEVHRLLSGGRTATMTPDVTTLYREIATRRNFSILHLQEFDPGQVSSYVERRCGEHAGRVGEFIRNTYNLDELSRRPVLLDMIVSSADVLANTPREINAGTLYDAYTNIWLTKSDWSDFLDIDAKTELLENFAARTWNESDYQIHYDSIPKLITSWKPSFSDVERAAADRDLRTASFLVRDAAGNYRFSHSSFREFFYARYLVAQAEKRNLGAWMSGTFQLEVYRFIQYLLPARTAAWQTVREWAEDRSLHAEMRVKAIKCLMYVQDSAVTQTLTQILSDDELHARRIAATILGFRQSAEAEALLNECLSRPDEDIFVRAHSAMALARMNTSHAKGLLMRHLSGPMPPPWRQMIWKLLMRAITATRDLQLADACIRHAAAFAYKKEAVYECIGMADAVRTPASVAFCETVVENRSGLGLIGEAFSALPAEARLRHVDRILDVVLTRRDHPVESLILSLKGLHTPRVASVLTELAGSKSLSCQSAAIEVLSQNHPEVLRANHERWTAKGVPLSVRARVVEAYVEDKPDNGSDFLIDILISPQRTMIKITALKLMFRHYRAQYFEAVRRMWNQEPTVSVRRHALELLLQLDATAAADFAREHALNSRLGLRSYACAILAGDRRDVTTDALLDRLREDAAPDVRMQALRSLAVPGRGVPRETILGAMGNEREPSVLHARDTLLG